MLVPMTIVVSFTWIMFPVMGDALHILNHTAALA